MLKIAILYPHLLATCLAIGVVMLTDLRLLTGLGSGRMVIAAPGLLERRAVWAALALLYLSGAALVWSGLQERADYLGNPKLQAKLWMVLALTLNGLFLHRTVFPRLAREASAAAWGPRLRGVVSLSVGLSNSAWLLAAFLGIARPWNFSKPIGELLALWAIVWAGIAALVWIVLRFAAAPGRDRWLPAVKARFEPSASRD